MASSKDYRINNFTLETFIPETLRNKSSSTLVKNLFDRHLTKDESKRFYGYVGKKQTDVTDNIPFVTHFSEERRINNLHPLITGTVGTEEHVFSFNDVLNHCKNLKIDTDLFHRWGATISFNLAPPIDYDKFVNYKRYYWIAKSLYQTPIINGNPTLSPEYIVIKKHDNALKADVDYIQTAVMPTGNLGDRFYFISPSDTTKNGIYEVRSTGVVRSNDFNEITDLIYGAIINVRADESVIIVNPLSQSSIFNTEHKFQTVISKTNAINDNLPIISDWEKCNYWVHEEDLKLLDLKVKSYTQAIRPIIEFNSEIELVENRLDNERNTQRKQYLNQQPIFKHYHFNGSESKTSGSILSYTEDPNAAIDQFLQRRIAREKNTNDFLFSQSLLEPETNATLFFKEISFNVQGNTINSNFSLKSIWTNGPTQSTPIIANQENFTKSNSVIRIDSLYERQSTDTVKFTALEVGALEFESKVLGKYPGPIVRTNVNPMVRAIKVMKDGSLPPDTELVPQTSNNLPYFISQGYVELMTPIYKGETIEIPGYIKFTYEEHPDPVEVPPKVYPVKDDSCIKKVYTAEIPRYVAFDENDNLIDYYRGEDYDLAYAKATGTKPFGAWLAPKQLKQNISHENRRQFAYGDLTGHFRLVMGEQAGIQGSLNGINNFRNLKNKNFGIGGLIKNYNVEYNLLISYLLQDDITPLTLINFIESQYDQNLLSISEFLKRSLSDLFLKHGADEFLQRDPNSPFIAKLYEEYATYYRSRSDLSMFNDSTMPIPNWVATLPVLKITPISKSGVSYDEDVGQLVIEHHDGHRSSLTPEDGVFNQRVAEGQKNPNVNTGGFYDSSSTPPTSKRWYKGMAWFNPTTAVLRVLDVISDKGTLEDPPLNGMIGNFWLNDNVLYIFDGTDWVLYSGDPMAAWKQVKTSHIFDSLILHIEDKIFNSIVADSSITSTPTTITKSAYEPELVRFAAKYNLDTYAPEYISTNPWTWNYKRAIFTIDPTLNGTARWEQIYKKYLGTKRPYLFPWRVTNSIGTAYATSDIDITAFTNTFKTRFQDTDNLELYPLANLEKVGEVRLLVDTNITLSSAPTIVDGVTLNNDDLVMLVFQNDPVENGFYQVVSPGNWVKLSVPLSYNVIPSGCSWAHITSGVKWKNTVWVVSDSSLNSFEQYRYWTMSMWNVIRSYSGKKLCMDVYRERMIPPYVHHNKIESAEALLTIFPSNLPGQPGIHSPYEFGDFGPTELFWRKTSEFKTATVRASFRESPLDILKKTWGDVYASNTDNLQFNRYSVKKLTHANIKLHGETLDQVDLLRPTALKVDGLSIAASNIFSKCNIKLILIDQTLNENKFRTLPIFKLLKDDKDEGVYVKTSEVITDPYLTTSFVNTDGTSSIVYDNLFSTNSFHISEAGHGFRVGDVISFDVMKSGIDQNSVTLTQNLIQKVLGLNQTYTHLMKYNNYDIVNSFNNTFLRKWNIKYGYRFDSIVRSEDVKISSETFDIPNALRTIHLKVNPRVSNFWIHALRIQVVRAGNSVPATNAQEFTNSSGTQVGILGIVPAGDASDWEFRIENYNAREPFIDVFTYDTSPTGKYATYTPLNTPKFRTWKKYSVVTGVKTISLPKIVTGLQNMLDIVQGYVDKLEYDGWRFNLGYEPNIDAEINRTITWHSEIEKLISYIYTSINEGEGHILNPFNANLWFQTPYGLLSKFETSKFVDFDSSQVACDIYGNAITVDNLRVLRNEDIAQVTSVIPMFSAHLFVDEYEHVVLFENYVDVTNKFTLIFDPYLGIFVSRLLIDGHQHSIRTGRPVLGGHYLKGPDMVQNMMSQTDEIADYYNATKILSKPKIAKNSLALLGFNKKQYFEDIRISDISQFNFWQAMIQSKGTNQNIDAYLNNNLFKTAYLDEYWAYKIAEYGDARTEEYPELLIEPADLENSYTVFKFHGLDDLNYAPTTNRIVNIDQFSDGRWSYTNQYDQKIIQYFMTLGPNNEWTVDLVKLDAVIPEKRKEFQKILNKHFYFSAKKVAVINNFERDVLVGKVQMAIEPREENGDITDPNNKIYTVKVPAEAIHSDLVKMNYYKIENEKEVLVKSDIVKKDSTPLFTWTDSEWTTLTPTIEFINKSGPDFTLNNLVYRNQFYNTNTDSYENIFSINPSRLLSDNRSNLESDIVITRINGKYLRFIPNNTTNEFSLTIGSDVIIRMEIEFYAVDIEKHNGTKLLDYSKSTIVDDVPLWHPQVQSVSGIALRDVDYKVFNNPAKYNHVPNNYRNAAFTNNQYWDYNQVGTTWWDLSSCEYSPYYDNIVFPLLQDRISRWGKLVDFASIKIYEWVESTVPPTEYDAKAILEETDFGIDESIRATGRAALTQYVRRQRIWWSQPVVWAHLGAPATGAITLNSGVGLQDTRMILSGTSGSIWVTVDNGQFDNYGIKEGTMMCGWGNSGYDTLEENVPFGQLKFGGEETSIIGQDISDEYFRNAINFPGTYPLTPLFTTIKTRSSEMAKVYNTLSGVTATTFKRSWLISSVEISKVNENKPIRALSTITFNVDNFVWAAGFINKELVPGTTKPTTNRKGVNDDNLYLTLTNGETKESVQIPNGFICSATKPIVIDFTSNNLRVTFNINQEYFDPTGLGKTYTAHPVYDLFGGKQEIDKVEDLDPSITPAQLKNYTDRDGEFYQFDTFTGGVRTGILDTGSVYVRKMISATVLDTFDDTLLSNNLVNTGTAVRPEKSRGWRIYDQPTQAQLDKDAPAPFNLWVPIIGEARQITQEETRVIDNYGTTAKFYSTSPDIIELGVKSIKEALADKNGNLISPFTTTWGKWVEIKDQFFRKVVVNIFDDSKTFEITVQHDLTVDNINVFLNGQIQPKSFYSIEGQTLTFDKNENLPQGSEIIVRYSPQKPTDAELVFDPDVLEDYEKQNHFKKDYPFSMIPIRDANGGISDYRYFFWVENKTTVSRGKLQSTVNMKSLIENKPFTFLTIQDILPEKIDFTTTLPISDIKFNLPVRYQTVTVHGIDTFVKRNDSFKLRFVKNFTLRNEVNGLDLKNTHKEWVLIRPGLSNRLIPKKLWNKFVDSVCGENIKGNIIPSNERVDYDEHHLTKTRYGFAEDQTLCDSTILIKTIKYSIKNTKILKLSKEGVSSQDFIDFLDLDNLDQYFSSPKKCREILDVIWVKAKKRQVNEIFFACLEDIAALNYEMTDLFKTSRLSVYSLRTIHEIEQTGIVYDD